LTHEFRQRVLVARFDLRVGHNTITYFYISITLEQSYIFSALQGVQGPEFGFELRAGHRKITFLYFCQVRDGSPMENSTTKSCQFTRKKLGFQIRCSLPPPTLYLCCSQCCCNGSLKHSVTSYTKHAPTTATTVIAKPAIRRFTTGDGRGKHHSAFSPRARLASRRATTRRATTVAFALHHPLSGFNCHLLLLTTFGELELNRLRKREEEREG